MEGRPLKYETVEELQESIDSWFDSFEGKHGVHPTMSGLAYHLGFADRQSLYDYKNRPEFSCTIKRALLRIEMLHEGNLFHQGSTGSIFWLKNRDWRDKTETEHSGKVDTSPQFDISKLNDDELRTLAELQRKSGTSKA